MGPTPPKTPLDRWMRDNDRDDAEIARALDVSRSQVNRLRNGASKPSWETAAALERLTGIAAGELFQPLSSDQEGRAA